MPELRSVQYGRIMTWLKKTDVKKIAMLGGESYFYIKYENPVSFMTIGINGKSYYIDRLLWERVCERMDSLPLDERTKPSNYSTTKGWKNPNYVLAPDIPAICNAYLNQS